MATLFPKFAKVVNSILGTTGFVLVRKSSLDRLATAVEAQALCGRQTVGFQPYVAKQRFIGNLEFDFMIANEVGKSWYDSSAEQYLPERQWCISQIRPGMTIVDCGAHHGMMSTIFSLATGPAGRVIAYEVLPSNADIVVINAALNKLANVTVRGVGVGNHAGKFAFNDNGSNTVVGSNTTDRGENVVEIVRLDDDLPIDLKVDFLKIDVEGHEVEAMQGMRRIIAQRPYIDLEVHNFLFNDRNASLQKIATMLEGYTFKVLGEILNGSGIREFGTNFPLDFIAGFDNPHVFCSPAAKKHYPRYMWPAHWARPIHRATRPLD